MTVRLSIGRLQYPTELSEQAQRKYEAYVLENAQEAADYFLKEQDLEGVRWLLELFDRIAEQNRDRELESTGDSLADTGKNHAEHMSGSADSSPVGQNAWREKQAALQTYMMEAAAHMQFTEATGFLMNFGRAQKRPARRRLEL